MPLTAKTPEELEQLRLKAAAARKATSAALAGLKAGKFTIADVLKDPDHVLQRSRVRTVLVHLPGVGAIGADKHLAGAQVDGNRRLRTLGRKPREALFGPYLAHVASKAA